MQKMRAEKEGLTGAGTPAKGLAVGRQEMYAEKDRLTGVGGTGEKTGGTKAGDACGKGG